MRHIRLRLIGALQALRDDRARGDLLMDFVELRDRIGFNEYYAASSVYETSKRDH